MKESKFTNIKLTDEVYTWGPYGQSYVISSRMASSLREAGRGPGALSQHKESSGVSGGFWDACFSRFSINFTARNLNFSEGWLYPLRATDLTSLNVPPLK
jgi:hypothetical protein